ncbi:MAG: GspE/PulE family protein [Gammaproteobacteria bacterium]
MPPSLSTQTFLPSLIERLIQRQVLTPEAVERIQSAAAVSREPFAAVATRLGLVSEYTLATVFAELLHLEVIRRPEFPEQLDTTIAWNLPFLKRKRVLPLTVTAHAVDVAMADPGDETTVRAIAFASNRQVNLSVALESELDDFFYKAELAQADTGAVQSGPAALAGAHQDDLIRLNDMTSDAPVIRLVNRIILEASDLGASDIHIEPGAHALTLRYRLDGLLQTSEVLTARWSEPVVARVKLMARLDIAEKRLPQDGRIRFAARGHTLDLRVATFPCQFGESIVIRLLGQHSVDLNLAALDLSAHGLSVLKQALQRPHGIILLTGPTGSGKTTTLYAALRAIYNPALKIVTVEDPIEYVIEGVSQLQIKPEIDLTYAAALRSILRNDPDIIMIGEIRDRETADSAIRAALTGHLVLSTLHTNTAAGAVTRLLDLGVEAFLLASTLELSAAQRLVRRLCPQCKQAYTPTDEQFALIARAIPSIPAPIKLYQPAGCDACKHTGYKGRTPLFEAILIGDEERALIRTASDETQLAAAAACRGGTTLWQHGLEKVVAGETSFEEILRVVE